MKKFLLHITCFSAAFVLFLSTTYAIHTSFVNASQYTLVDDVEVIIVGDSRPRFALDPEIIKNSVNICLNGEPYIITYYKLLDILKHNNNIKTVIIGFASNNLSTWNDKMFSQPMLAKMIENYHTIVDFDDLKELKISYEDYYKSFVIERLFPNFSLLQKLSQNKFPHIGSHKQTEDVITSQVGQKRIGHAIERHYGKPGKHFGISQISIKYLLLIIGLLQENNIKLFLITTPEHKKYQQKIPEKFIIAFASLEKKIAEKYNVKILNFKNEKLADGYFFDGDHVNSKGAKIISQKVNKVVTK